MCDDKTPANDRENGAYPWLIEDEPKNGMWGISPTMASILAISSSEPQNELSRKYRLWTNKSIPWMSSIQYLGSQTWKYSKWPDHSHNWICRRRPEPDKSRRHHSWLLFCTAAKSGSPRIKDPVQRLSWVGPFIIQEVLPNENYIVRRLNTNKTQILHWNRPKKFVPNQLLEDSFLDERLQPDEEIVIPQDDIYTISWQTNFGDQLTTRGNEPIPTNLPNGKQPLTAEVNPNDAHENETDYTITTDSPNDVSDAEQIQNERMKSDVTNRNEASEAIKNENSDLPNSAVYHKNQEKSLPDLSGRQENEANFSKTKEILPKKTMHKSLRKEGMILSCPKYRRVMMETNMNPRGERYNLRPNHVPNYSEDFRY